MRWEGGEDNESDIDSPYVRYEGEISDADINKMVDGMQVDGSGEVDDDDINRMIDSMQVWRMVMINVAVEIPAQVASVVPKGAEPEEEATSAAPTGAEGAAARG